ncbi:MAG: ABC transporter ATP-binding protein [Mogibacterium sp.]|nr:ABC transporter ATP-binding protein [Mogibacterium sp.]
MKDKKNFLNNAASSEIIDLSGIYKRYFENRENELEVLHGVDLKVKRGEFISIVGASGSGKSTLMNIIGALDRPSEGSYTLDGRDIAGANDTELSHIRNALIGFVFQTYNLIPRMSALRNVELPLCYAGVKHEERRRKAVEMLGLVDMKDRMEHNPDELSGGQKQRVAIARALVNDPAIILADEPTGALDSATGRMIMDLFHSLHEERGITIVLITHSPELAEETDRVITLSDGLIIGERKGRGHA